MIFAWIDPRPLIGFGLLPVAVLIGCLLTRFTFRRSSWIICQTAAFAVVFAVYQLIFFGPYIDKNQVVSFKGLVTWRPDLGVNAVEFDFSGSSEFGGLISRDADVAKHIRENDLKEIDVAVELSYDFGRARGMNLSFAYADGIIFLPLIE